MIITDGTGPLVTAFLGAAKSGYYAIAGVCLIAARID